MDQRGFSRKFSQVYKINLKERVRRKKVASVSQVQRDETACARAMPKKLLFKPVEQIEAASSPGLKDTEVTTRTFSHFTEKDLPENRIRNLRRLSQADIPSCSDEYKTVLEDLKDPHAKNNLAKKLSKYEQRTCVTNEARKTSRMADFIIGRSRKTTVSTFQSPKLGSRTFTLPVVPEAVTTPRSFSRKTAWIAKSTSPGHCYSLQMKSHEKPKRHVSLPCPPKLETTFEQENKKLEVTKSGNYPLVIKKEIRSVQSEKNRTFSAARSSNTLSKGEYLTELCPEIRYEQNNYSRSRHNINATSSFLSMKPNFKSVGKAALAARILIENYYCQQQCRRTEQQTDGKSIDKLFEEMKGIMKK